MIDHLVVFAVKYQWDIYGSMYSELLIKLV